MITNKYSIPLLSNLEEDTLLECDKCELEYKSNRILNFTCGHKICEKCSFAHLLSHISITSQGLSGNINQNSLFPCASCNKGNSEFIIKNFFLNNVVKRSFTQNLYGKTCDACDSLELKTYCYQCQSYFCKKCLDKIHNSIIAFRTHRITDNFSDFPEKIYCNCDEEKEIFYVCCDMFLCEICIIRFHLSHPFKFLNNTIVNDDTYQLFNNESYYNLDVNSNKDELLESKIEVDRYEKQINHIHSCIKKNFENNKNIFSNLMNTCLKVLDVLQQRIKNAIEITETIYSTFCFFLDSVNNLQEFLKHNHLKINQQLYTSTVVKTLSKLEKKEDQINSILITDFLNLNIESDEDNDSDSKYNEELVDRMLEVKEQKKINIKKKKPGRLDMITKNGFLESPSRLFTKSLSKSYKTSSTSHASKKNRSLGENLVHNDLTRETLKKTSKKNYYGKYNMIKCKEADPLKLKCTLVFEDAHMSISSYPNQFTIFSTPEYRDSLCWINNFDYSIEIIDFDYQGWFFNKDYRERLKKDKIKLKAHTMDIVSLKFFVIMDKYCLITCSLDEKCRVFDCQDDYDNFLTINCNYKPYSAEMFETYDDDEDASVGFIVICGFNKNTPIKIYNTRTINISDDIYRSIKVEGNTFNISHKKIKNKHIYLFASVFNLGKYYFNVYDFKTGDTMKKVEIANYINSFIFREVVNYESNKKNILAVFNDRSGNLYEYDMGLGKITNSISGIGYFGMDNFHDQYLIVCGKKHSIEIIDIDTFQLLKTYNYVHLETINNIIMYSHKYYGSGIFTFGGDRMIKLLR